jgi:hypothetical protein
MTRNVWRMMTLKKCETSTIPPLTADGPLFKMERLPMSVNYAQTPLKAMTDRWQIHALFAITL